MKGLFQCPPWAKSFWAFSPYLKHFVKVQLHIHNFLDGYMTLSVGSLNDGDAMTGSR